MVDVWGKSLRDNHEVENQVIHFQLKYLNLTSQYEERLANAEKKLTGNNLMGNFVKKNQRSRSFGRGYCQSDRD